MTTILNVYHLDVIGKYNVRITKIKIVSKTGKNIDVEV